MKKILAILLAAVMTFSMAISVAAADVSGKIDEVEEVVSDVCEAASDAYDEATGVHDSIEAGECTEAVSGSFSLAKAVAKAIHTLVHRLSDLFDFDCPFCDGIIESGDKEEIPGGNNDGIVDEEVPGGNDDGIVEEEVPAW